uniref:C-type lectin domain-containing protein n=1 Tax=Caenorhabditis japonica TaxID=281687 RepID=A0A8R1DVI1_CAEJA
MSSNKQLLILFLLGAILLISVAGHSRRGRHRHGIKPTPQRDYEEDEEPESCPDDNEDDDDEDGGDQRQSIPYGDDNGAGEEVEEEEDDESDNDNDNTGPSKSALKRYQSWNNKNGVCILEHKKCPADDWKMFQRENDTVCLKVFGVPSMTDLKTASSICRANHNARMMTLNSQEEKEWIYTVPLANNGSFPWMNLAGYRNRKCQMDPSDCRKDKLTAFTQQDGTANPKFIYTRWGISPLNYKTLRGHLDNCVVLLTHHSLKGNDNVIRDTPCDSMVRTFLCGVTVL